MDRRGLQVSVAGMLALVASVALNVWLFRFGVLAGLLGLSITKHVLIAQLCMGLGVNRRAAGAPTAAPRESSPVSSAP